MSRHVHDDETQMAGERTMGHRHSHYGHLSLNPATVIDHLKTKVKRRRLSKTGSFEISDSALSNHTNGNTNNNNNNVSKRSSQDHHEIILDKSSTSTRSHTPIPLRTLSSIQQSIGDNDSEYQDENRNEHDSVFPFDLNQDDDISESAQCQSNEIVPDTNQIVPDTNQIVSDTDQVVSDTNQKITKPKYKPIKASKSLPETNAQPNIKKRRQTIRRMGFQIRDEDFRSIFSDLPPDEHLIIAYPCAWRKDVYMHGRMFISVNYFCFYTCFFKWEESLCIAYKDIVSVTREKSAKLVPNAIKLRTKNEEQYVFTSYMPRERIFIAIFRSWQNALLEQPLDYQQLRGLLYADQQIHDESSGGSEESLVLENSAERSPESRLHLPLSRITSDRSTEVVIRPRPAGRSSRRVVSLPPDNETINYLPSCTCESHPSKTYCDRTFSFNVDTLFELISGDNSFSRAFYNSQKLTEYTFGEWRLNDETGKRERQVTYKTISRSILGTNTLFCQEKQTLEVEKPHLMYVVSIEVHNEGVKYTDAFYVATRFCMVQRDAEHSSLRISAEIRYVKSVNGFIKSFIEKNANSSLEGGIQEQIQRLENQQVAQSNPKSNQKSMLKYKQSARTPTDNNTSQNQTGENSSLNSFSLSESKITTKAKSISGKGILYDIGLFIGIVLLLLHGYLCYKLYAIDQVLVTPNVMCLDQCKKTCFENTISR